MPSQTTCVSGVCPSALGDTETERGPWRILFLDHTAMLGGGEIALLNLVRHLDHERVTPIVVLCSDGPLAERLRTICQVHILPLSQRVGMAKKDNLGWRSLLGLRHIGTVILYSFTLARFAAKNGVDLIHTNSLKADIIGGIAGRLARRPVVWHIRDRIESDYLPESVVRAFRLLCRFLPTYVIANSDAVLKTLRLRQNRLATSISSRINLMVRVAVIRDATIVPTTPAASDFPSRRQQVIGLIGRICPWKGQHVFLKAASIVRRRHPATLFKIVGAPLFGEAQYDAEIRQLSNDLGLDDAVEFTGFRPDVAEVIAALDIVVHASTTGEPFGQVIIEGMAASKPVIATKGGGVPEIVVDGVTGLLVPMGDAPAMADAICKMLGDPALAHRMGAEGFKRVQEHFTIEKAVRKVEAVYSLLLDKSRDKMVALR
jgi:glycosyltransferase involved in cell wall biosynthesis